jgi:hypothetical protein
VRDGVVWAEQSDTDLRLKTARLLGRQSLQQYKGWKGNEAAIARECVYPPPALRRVDSPGLKPVSRSACASLPRYEKNKEIGQRLNMWKAGVLVADDNGLVEEAIRASNAAADASAAKPST